MLYSSEQETWPPPLSAELCKKKIHCSPLVTHPLSTGMLGHHNTKIRQDDKIKAAMSDLCCLQCDAAAMTAGGIAARTLSSFASNMLDVTGPLIASGFPSAVVGSPSK